MALGEQSKDSGGTSLGNQMEADVVLQLCEHLNQLGASFHKIAVLTPYRQQVFNSSNHFCMRIPQVDLIIRRLGKCRMTDVKVATIDSFQGQEADVVIYSCVRANLKGGCPLC